MKELSIEEKAKAYDNIIEKANKMHHKNCEACQMCIEELIPELAESEDEKIRKGLINGFKFYSDQEYWGTEKFPLKIKDIIAYLEKKGEQKSVFEMKNPEESLGIDSDTYNKIVDECIYGEQKPTDKVEPKFKVGDWIKHNKANFIFQINKVTTKNYEFNNPDGYNHSLSIKSVDEKYHLWTIQDAKDGDVLVASDSSIFLFKGTIDSACKHYVSLTTDGAVKFNEGLKHYWETSRAVHPATKEQRDLLFQRIHEAGYEWDADKKELKKIEPKTVAWTTMDEQRVENLLAIIEGHGYPGEVAWIKLLKDRYTWKPSDKQMKALNDINLTGSISYVGQGQELINLYNDLKKLK